jgi:putative transposase
MSRDTTVIAFRQPEAIDDPLSELAREGARRMLAQVLIAEADSFVAMWKDLKLPDGRNRIVRHGHGPHRTIQTAVGPVEVRRAKVRDRDEVGAEEKIRFSSSILPKWARRTKSLDTLLPVLYLRGVSTGDFQEVIAEHPEALAELRSRRARAMRPPLPIEPELRLRRRTRRRADRGRHGPRRKHMQT